MALVVVVGGGGNSIELRVKGKICGQRVGRHYYRVADGMCSIGPPQSESSVLSEEKWRLPIPIHYAIKQLVYRGKLLHGNNMKASVSLISPQKMTPLVTNFATGILIWHEKSFIVSSGTSMISISWKYVIFRFSLIVRAFFFFTSLVLNIWTSVALLSEEKFLVIFRGKKSKSWGCLGLLSLSLIM